MSWSFLVGVGGRWSKRGEVRSITKSRERRTDGIPGRREVARGESE